MENDLVTIRRYHFLGEAHVVRGLLESVGIPCFVANQITASHSVFAGGLGGVCLQVRSRDVESAEELLQEDLLQEELLQELTADDAGPEAPLPEISLPEARETCPSCLLGGISVKRAVRECLNCGYRWTEP
jgi:Putative prokaryotic signal transducing protein